MKSDWNSLKAGPSELAVLKMSWKQVFRVHGFDTVEVGSSKELEGQVSVSQDHRMHECLYRSLLPPLVLNLPSYSCGSGHTCSCPPETEEGQCPSY